MVHVPVDRQIALLKLQRERPQLAQLGGEVAQHGVDEGWARPLGQLGHNGIQRRYRRTRGRGLDRRADQAVYLIQQSRIRHAAAIA